MLIIFSMFSSCNNHADYNTDHQSEGKQTKK